MKKRGKGKMEFSKGRHKKKKKKKEDTQEKNNDLEERAWGNEREKTSKNAGKWRFSPPSKKKGKPPQTETETKKMQV